MEGGGGKRSEGWEGKGIEGSPFMDPIYTPLAVYRPTRNIVLGNLCIHKSIGVSINMQIRGGTCPNASGWRRHAHAAMPS